MGWNRGYTVYEQTVVEAYNTGELTPKMLRAILKPYAKTDIDHGGRRHLETHDGLTADEVVLKLLATEAWLEYKNNERFDMTGAWLEIIDAASTDVGMYCQ